MPRKSKKKEEKVEEVVEETPVTTNETDPSTHTIPRDNAVDPNSPQYVN